MDHDQILHRCLPRLATDILSPWCRSRARCFDTALNTEEVGMTRIMNAQRQDEARIRDLIAGWEEAMRNRDAERVVTHFAPGAMVFDMAPPLRQDAAVVTDVAPVRQWFAQFDDTFDFEVRDLAVTVGTHVAYAHSLNRMGTTTDAPEQFQLWFRATYGLRKLGDEWLITHLHESTPFYMEAPFTAAVDLEP
jgi:ketosteroid isomerase-like protein